VRLATFATAGAIRCGGVVGPAGDERVVDLGRASAGRLPADLLALLELPDGIDRAAEVVAAAEPDHLLAEVRLLAPLRRPPKLLAVAANYQSHILEAGRPPVDRRRIVPKLFLKPSTCVIGPDHPLPLPALSDRVDWEVELAAVIGARASGIAAEAAPAHVAGYTIVNDVSARRLEWGVERDRTDSDGFFDWLSGKWPDGFAPMGPWLVTRDEVPDPQDLGLRLRVNRDLRQDGTTRDMLFGVAELVAFASRIMTLEPGDVISTGTPAGVGDTTATYLRPGDVMEAEVDRIGTLRTPVA
jgi:2-keto-4-pentenoate hydratase/2-oxohepta-3-ene-1,7-dioic acid hydratase in catechol pathway